MEDNTPEGVAFSSAEPSIIPVQNTDRMKVYIRVVVRKSLVWGNGRSLGVRAHPGWDLRLCGEPPRNYTFSIAETSILPHQFYTRLGTDTDWMKKRRKGGPKPIATKCS